MNYIENEVISVFRGNYPGNQNHWQISWDADGLPSLIIFIPKKSDDWKTDWKNFVFLKKVASADSSFGQHVPESATLVDRVTTQEIFCNTVMTFVDTRDPNFRIEKTLRDHATKAEIRETLQSLAQELWDEKVWMDFSPKLEFSIRLLNDEFCEVFKSGREKLMLERLNRASLVTTDQATAPWRL